jgi:hypothetical protein
MFSLLFTFDEGASGRKHPALITTFQECGMFPALDAGTSGRTGTKLHITPVSSREVLPAAESRAAFTTTQLGAPAL